MRVNTGRRRDPLSETKVEEINTEDEIIQYGKNTLDSVSFDKKTSSSDIKKIIANVDKSTTLEDQVKQALKLLMK